MTCVMRPTVRQASTGDARAIAAVGKRSFTAAYAASTSPEDLREHVAQHFTVAAVRAAMADPACRYFLAEIDDQCAGLAKTRHGGSPASDPGKAAIEIQQLYVEPSFQRRGVGEALVSVTRQIATDTGAEGVWLSVWEDAGWAVAFYEACEFRAIGKADFRVGKTPYRDLLMWLPVRNGSS